MLTAGNRLPDQKERRWLLDKTILNLPKNQHVNEKTEPGKSYRKSTKLAWPHLSSVQRRHFF